MRYKVITRSYFYPNASFFRLTNIPPTGLRHSSKQFVLAIGQINLEARLAVKLITAANKFVEIKISIGNFKVQTLKFSKAEFHQRMQYVVWKHGLLG